MPASSDRARSFRGGPVPLLATALAAALVVVPASGAAQQDSQQDARQDLAAAVSAARSDVVWFGFPARPGVCGAGDGIVIREPGGSTTFIRGHMSSADWRRWREGEPPCETGDVLVRLDLVAGQIADLDLRVGTPGDTGDPAAGTAGADLGLFTAQAAADYLLARAPAAEPKVAGRVMLAASLGRDVVTWPALLDMARDRGLPSRVRRQAIQHLGRQAAAEAVRELGGIARDRTEEQEIREAAVFGLSQLPDDRAVPLLIEVYRTIEDPRIRGRALFWLAEFDDERVTRLFEEVLVGGAGGG